MAIGSVANFIKEVNKFNRTSDTIRFFRGQSNIHWKLVPSILREEYSELLINESILIKEIYVHYPDIFRNCDNAFEKLVIAQHYGIPTRLLDITSNPLVALYFACSNKKVNSGNSIVYIIDIPKAKLTYFDDNRVENMLNNNCSDKVDDWLCIKAKMNNPRILNQNGAFILFRMGFSEKKDVLENYYNTIEISSSHLKKVLEDLQLLGISHETLFPEFVQYAKEIRERKRIF